MLLKVPYFRGVTPLIVRLQYYREKKGLSQLALSKLSGVSQPTISRIEAGKRAGIDLLTLEKLAKALAVSPRSLIVSK